MENTAMKVKVGTREIGYEVMDMREKAEIEKLQRYCVKIDEFVTEVKKFFAYFLRTRLFTSIGIGLAISLIFDTFTFGIFTPFVVTCHEFLESIGADVVQDAYKRM